MSVCFEFLFSVLLVTYAGVELLGHIVMLYLAFWGTTKLFSVLAALFYIPASNVQESKFFLHAHQQLIMFLSLSSVITIITIIIAILVSVKWYLLVLICISQWLRMLSLCLPAIGIPSLASRGFDTGHFPLFLKAADPCPSELCPGMSYWSNLFSP